jgi:hypothetical protein
MSVQEREVSLDKLGLASNPEDLGFETTAEIEPLEGTAGRERAVRDGTFKIYAVSTIDEGMEVLTEVSAGECAEDGTYPEYTVHLLVERRPRGMARKARRFGSDGRSKEEENREDPDGR